MHTAGLIVAAGRGQRLGHATPKQYLPLGGGTVLGHAIGALLAHPAVDLVRVVIHPDDRDLYDAAVAGIGDPRLGPPVAGGERRSDSVLAGLEALADAAPARVLIHDAARPFVAVAVIGAVLDAHDEVPAAFPALPVVDALWRGTGDAAEVPAPREGLWRAQTPQGFRFAEILAAHRAHVGEALDDVAVATAAGHAARIVPGDEAAFKITTAADLARARTIPGGKMDIRTGNGFDVHAFGPGDAVTLCGVTVAHDHGLVGHSDADVGLHALTDAIFGALAEGDIGQWFPPSDPRWKGAASAIFLEKAAARARDRGFAVTHLDCTLVCEAPKIGPHAAAMRAAVAAIAGVDPDRVSVKATTSERLGFTGREEGLAAMAVVSVELPS
jgi:2-C-methyl-D-erythritol 4-phosphate cytidylyltransferase/2-C-methyl-D-erythritol 2,4-cyclodiphosphate synthase